MAAKKQSPMTAPAKKASAPKTAPKGVVIPPAKKGKSAATSAPSTYMHAGAKDALAYRVIAADFTAGATVATGLPAPALAEVAFAGRSNVGKSTLLNMLMQRKNLVRTSNTPGATRQINFFGCKVQLPRPKAAPPAPGVEAAEAPVASDAVVAEPVATPVATESAAPTEQPVLDLILVDLPGYGFAKVSKSEARSWGPMMEGYLTTRIALRAVFVLVDARRGPEDDDFQLVEFMKGPRAAQSARPVEVIIVATKLDKLPKNQQKPALEAISKKAGVRVIGASGETAAGREDLWRKIVGSVL
jgi:GTP-binding protein